MTREAATPRPLLVAILDDEVSVRVGLRRLCEALGFRTTLYASGPQFIESLTTDAPRPDCLLLDAHMPEMSGLEVLQQLATGGVDIPTVVFTADDVPEVQARYRAAGVTEYLHKPILGEELRGAIERVVSRKGGGR